jgi:hypothetical protein
MWMDIDEMDVDEYMDEIWMNINDRCGWMWMWM